MDTSLETSSQEKRGQQTKEKSKCVGAEFDNRLARVECSRWRQIYLQQRAPTAFDNTRDGTGFVGPVEKRKHGRTHLDVVRLSQMPISFRRLPSLERPFETSAAVPVGPMCTFFFPIDNG